MIKKIGEWEVILDDSIPFDWNDYWWFTEDFRSRGQRRVKGLHKKTNERFYLHRLILGLKKGDGKFTDHINRNPLDNRRCNLRIVTPAQSVINRTSRNGKNRNISFRKKPNLKRPWRVDVQLNRINHYGGIFSTRKEARKKVDEMRKELYGEFYFPL